MKQRSIEELLMRAHEELAVNESIMTYEILPDGFEIRRPANPFASMRGAFQKLNESAARVAESITALGEALRKGST